MPFVSTATSASHEAATLFASALFNYEHNPSIGELTGLAEWEYADDVLERVFPWSYRLFADDDAGYVLQADDDESYAYVALGLVSANVRILDASDERDADRIARAREFFVSNYAECSA